MAKSKRTMGRTRVVPQPHGGALRHGPNDGNGGGRHKQVFITACREALAGANGIGFVQSVLAGTTKLRVGTTKRGRAIFAKPAVRDRLRAFQILAEYARLTPVPGEVETSRKPVQLVLAVPNEKMAHRVIKQLGAGSGGIQVAVMSSNGKSRGSDG